MKITYDKKEIDRLIEERSTSKSNGLALAFFDVSIEEAEIQAAKHKKYEPLLYSSKIGLHLFLFLGEHVCPFCYRAFVKRQAYSGHCLSHVRRGELRYVSYLRNSDDIHKSRHEFELMEQKK